MERTTKQLIVFMAISLGTAVTGTYILERMAIWCYGISAMTAIAALFTWLAKESTRRD